MFKHLQKMLLIMALCLPWVTQAQTDSCTIKIVGVDDYGDGWNGGYLTVMSGTSTIAVWDGPDGDDYSYYAIEDSLILTVASNAPLSFVWSQGLYDDEVTIAIYNYAGVEIFNVEEPTAGTIFTWSNPCAEYCIPPSGLQCVSTTDELAVSWTAGGEETSWIVSNGINSYTVSSTSYTFTGLDLNTNYTVSVRALCSTGDTSTAIVANFRTLAGDPISLFPYTCDFETASDNTAWVLENGMQTNHWMIGNAVNNTTGGSTALYISSDDSANVYEVTASSSVFAYVTLSLEAGQYAVSFDWQGYGESNYDYMRAALVPASTNLNAGVATDWGTSTLPAGAIALDGGSKLNLQSAWQNNSAVATVATDGNYNLVFYWHNDYSMGTQPPAAVDNIVFTALTCPAPVNVTASGITTDEITISWSPTGNEGSWYVSNGIDEYVATDTFYTFQNLNTTTSYTFTVRAICGAGDTSFAATVQATTGCGTITTLPWIEGFENDATLTCWDVFDLDSVESDNWQVTTGYPHTGNRSAYSSYNYSAVSNEWLVSPAIEIPSSGDGVAMEWYAYGYSYGTYITHMTVVVSTAGADSAALFTDTLYSSDIVNGWAMYLADLSEYAGETINIAFIHDCENDYRLCIDDIRIYEGEPCLTPTDLSGTVTTDEIALSWNQSGSVSEWLVTYGNNSVVVNTTSYTLQNLTPNTFYTVSVRAICGEGDTSYAVSASFRTMASDPVETLPFVCDFSDGDVNSHWVLENGTQSNTWYIGSAVSTTAGDSALYISFNGGDSNAYDITSSSAVFAYVGINLVSGDYSYSYDWRSQGESTYDYLRVALVPASVDLTAGSSTGWSSYSLPTGAISLDGNNRLGGQSQWQTESGIVNVPTDGTYKLVFFWRNDNSMGTQPPAAVDNIMFGALSCPAPTQLTAISDSTEITVSWTPAGDESMWIVSNGIATVVVTDTFYTFQNLSPATSYNVTVAAICGADDTSLYVSAVFSTECGTPSLPFYEGFESPASVLCWEILDLDNNTNSNWYRTETSSHTGNACMRTGYNSTTNANDWLITPQLYLPVNNSGYYANWFAYGDSWVSDSTTMTVVVVTTDALDSTVYDTLFHAVLPDGWHEYTYDLSSYAGEYIKLAFIYDGHYDDGARLDDVTIDAIPTCPKPTEMFAISGLNDIQLNWNHGGYESMWEVSDGTTTVVVTDTFYTFTGLAAATTYNFTVRAICGVGDSSYYLTGSFATLNAMPVTTLPYVCGFDGAETTAWTLVCDGQVNAWVVDTAAHNGSADNYGLYISDDNGVSNSYATGSSSVSFAYRTINMPAGSFVFSFDWRANGESTYDYLRVALVPSSVELVAGTIGSWGTATIPAGAIALDGGSKLNLTPVWTNATAEFTLAAAGQYNLVFFWLNDGSVGQQTPAAVDNIYLGINSCPAVSDIHVVTAGEQNLAIDWTSTSSATAWQVQYGLNGFALGTGTTINATSHPVSISNLEALTVYDIYVRPICGAGDTGMWSMASFSTSFCDNSTSVTVGDPAGETGISNTMPIATYYNYSMNEVIVDSAMLGGPIDIDGIQLLYNGTGTMYDENDIDIYIQPTNKSAFVDETDMVAYDSTIGVHVFHGSFEDFVPGWNTLQFTNTFSYSGVGNLLVIFKKNSGEYNSNCYFVNSECYQYKSIAYYNDYSDPDIYDPSTFSGYSKYVYTYRPIMNLVNCNGSACPRPQGLTVSEADHTSATFTWIGSTSSYEVAVKAANEGTWPAETTVNTNSYSVNNLLPAQTYSMRVRSVCDGNEVSSWSVVSFVTDSLPCFAPSDFALVETTMSSATFSWTAGGEESAWRIHVWNPSFSQEYDVTTNPATVTGLTQNTAYMATIAALCGGVLESETADTIQFTTSVCQAPTGVSATEIHSTSATITWTGSAASYSLEYGPGNFSQGSGIMVNDITGTSYTITGLTPDRGYTVMVRAHCDAQNNSEWSDRTSFRTKEDGIDDIQNSEFKIQIFPNPTSDATTIALSGVNGEVIVTVVDMNGRTVRTETMDCAGDCTKRMDVSGLAAGSYFVRISGEGINTVKKLVVK